MDQIWLCMSDVDVFNVLECVIRPKKLWAEATIVSLSLLGYGKWVVASRFVASIEVGDDVI